MGSEKSSSPLHIAMFPFLAFGHISPFVQLSNKLSSHSHSHGKEIHISFLSPPGNVSRLQSMLIPSPNIQIIPLQMPSFPSLVPNDSSSTSDLPPDIAKNLVLVVDLMKPQIKTLLSDLKPHFIIFDFAQYWLPSIASELGIKSLFFSVFSAISTAYLTVPARLAGVDGNKVSFKDLEKPPRGFPGEIFLKEFEANNLMFLFTKFNDGPTGYERVMTGLNECSAIIAKSCYEMEASYLDFVKTQLGKSIFLTGPLVPEPSSGELDRKWDDWLSQFPEKSVIFCSFGSETFLEDDQIKELALGLEETNLPFFLVLNFPASDDAGAELERVLPVGFLERVKERGVIVTGWVQQALILAHRSVGCYTCHSGFSSVIEAMVNECQLVLVPFKGDQFLNAKLIGEDLKCGVVVNRRNEDGYFGKDDIYEAVKLIMVDKEKEPGKSIRANHNKWKEFLLNKEIHENFITNLVEELEKMAV